MGLTDDNGMNTTMLVGPTSAPYAQGGGFGNAFGGDGWWILLLFLLLGNGAWGGFGGFGGFGGAGELYPWMNQSNQINDGFRDQMLNGNVNEIRTGVTAIQSQLCNGFAGVNAGVAQGFANAETAANARQVANMQQAFAAQTAVTAGMNDIASGLQNCCCENRQSTANLKADLLQAMSSGFQSIKDDLCADRLAAAQRENADLRTQLQMAQLKASQTDQTAAIQAGQRALANEIEQYVLPTPRPAYVVANPNCCQTSYGCGCGA